MRSGNLSRPSIDEYMAQLLPLLASRGTCPRRKTSAIVTDEHGSLLGTGYNGVARGMPHCIDVPCPGANDPTGDNRRCEALHGEYNAIMQAGIRLPEATSIYTMSSPCFNCAKLILCTGIKEIIFLDFYLGDLSGITLLVKAGKACYRLSPAGRHAIGLDEIGALTVSRP